LRHPTNADVKAIAKPKAPASRTHFYQGAHLRTKQVRARCADFPKAHSITQAFGESAVTVSRDQESELTSSLKASCAHKPAI